MDPERHVRLLALFDEVCDLPADAQRARLAALREGDAALVADLAAMIAAKVDVTRVLQPPGDDRPRRKPVDRRLPDHVSHYRLGQKLGAGGMGVVYVAVDERLGRKVAIKLLPTAAEENVDQRMRMLREAQAASALNHPGIVTLHDVGAHEGRLFLVMELIGVSS